MEVINKVSLGLRAALQHKEEMQKLISNLESLKASGGISLQRYEFLKPEYQKKMEAAIAGVAAIKSRITSEQLAVKQGLNSAKTELDKIRAAYNTGSINQQKMLQEEERLNRYIERCRAQILQIQQLLDAKSTSRLSDNSLAGGVSLNKAGFPAWATVIISIVGVVVLGFVALIAISANSVNHGSTPSDISQLSGGGQSVTTAATDWPATIDKVEPCVVFILTYSNGEITGNGSGVIVDEKGYILTNDHVILNSSTGRIEDELFVYFYQGKEICLDDKRYLAQVVKRRTDKDLAILKITSASSLRSVAIGDSGSVQSGEEIRAIGYPITYVDKKTYSIGFPTVTQGIVSELPRDYTVDDFGLYGCNRIKISAPVNPGNSGGALINWRGELIGITHQMSTSSESQNQNFAISINEAKPMLQDVLGR